MAKVIGNNTLDFGTVHIFGKGWGECVSGSIKLTGNSEGVPDDMDGFQAMILTNDTYEVSFETVLSSTLVLPARGDRVDIGKINLSATITEWEITATGGKSNRLKITCSHWVSIGGAYGVGPAVTVLPVVPNVPASED